MSADTEVLTLNNERTIPVLGLGLSTWYPYNTGPHVFEDAVREAIRCGYRHFDTAQFYCTEEQLGRATSDSIALDGLVTREELCIVTKVHTTHMAPELAAKACRDSIKRLGLGYIDIYLIHSPMALRETVPFDRWGREDEFIDVDFLDTWRVMEELLKEGLVKSIGVSNFNEAQLQRILDSGLTKPVCNQIEVSPYCPNTALIAFCKQHDIVPVAYCPLGSPARAGRRPGEKDLLQDPKVLEIAEAIAKSPAQVVLRWSVQRGCAVIPKTTSPSRVRENAQIFDFTLSDDDMATLSDIGHYHRSCHFQAYVKHPQFSFTNEPAK